MYIVWVRIVCALATARQNIYLPIGNTMALGRVPISTISVLLLLFKLLLISVSLLLMMQPAGALANAIDGHTMKPSILVFYQQTNSTPQTSIRQITNSTLGVVSVIELPLTESADPSSQVVGWRYGVTSGQSGTFFDFQSSDFHIDWPDHEAMSLNGTFLVQGAVNTRAAVREFVVVGGSGSFYLARGIVYVSYANGNMTSATSATRVEAHFDFSCGMCRC
jgi:hypothetical protein